MFFLIGLITSTVLYLIVYMAFTDITKMFALILIYLVLRVVHYIFVIIDYKVHGFSTGDSFVTRILGYIGADITNPFRGLVAFVGAKKTIDSKGFWGFLAWATQTLHFVWAIALIGFFVFSFIKF